MRYMLLIYKDEKLWDEMSAQQKRAIFDEAVEFSGDPRNRGFFQAADPLEPTSTATTVRMNHGKPVITDGPFAETKEQLGGYYMVEAKDLDEAVSIAARIPTAKFGSIEVRPVRKMSM